MQNLSFTGNAVKRISDSGSAVGQSALGGVTSPNVQESLRTPPVQVRGSAPDPKRWIYGICPNEPTAIGDICAAEGLGKFVNGVKRPAGPAGPWRC